MSVIDQRCLGIGKWTATQMHPMGMIFVEPAERDGGSGAHGQRTFMYVQHVVGSGAVAYQGTPCTFATGIEDGVYIVNSDVSAGMANSMIGVYWNDSTTAVTTTYYGWIQLARPYEVLASVVVTSGGAAADRVVWITDGKLTTHAAYSSAAENIAIGVICTGGLITSHPSTTASGCWDIVVLPNPGD